MFGLSGLSDQQNCVGELNRCPCLTIIGWAELAAIFNAPDSERATGTNENAVAHNRVPQNVLARIGARAIPAALTGFLLGLLVSARINALAF